VIAALAFVALVVFLAVALMRLHATLVSLQSMVDDLHRSTVPVLKELQETVTSVNVEMDRIDGILSSAESVASSASSVAGLVSTAVSNPLVKGVAILAGVAAGARRFRKARAQR
jgi:uncharacterized protein YoxC